MSSGTELISPNARLVDAASGEELAGQQLTGKLAELAAGYAELPPGVVFARVALTATAALRYLAAWTAGRPVALLDPALKPAALADLIVRYEPAAVVGLAEGGAGAEPGELPKGYRQAEPAGLGPCWVRETASEHQPHPDLGILLTTSGSTGNPKLVRLSRQAVVSNAHAIAEVLRIGPDEVAPTCLPLFYSYGMSILNSHLAVGATVVVVDGGVLSREFWAAVERYRATSIAGVPYSYEMLARIRWSPDRYPSLKTLTQAGGRLRPELITQFHEKITAVGGRFYVMWGTTEAAPRLSTLPSEQLPAKLGSAGPALPGGRLSVITESGAETTEPGVTGEVVYRGPNVMMGYAETAPDLARPDQTGGVLRTGDLGHLDEDGYIWLTGRLKRIGKIFGIRVSLDDIEGLLRDVGPVAVVPSGDKVVIWCERLDESRRPELVGRLAEELKLHRSGFDVRTIDRLPLLPNGKVNYRGLEANS